MHKVVIVDDDSIIRRGLSLTIAWGEHGFEMAGVAGDGDEGFALIERTSPQLVITDIRMPFVDGFEMAEKIKKVYPDIKIIMLTSYEDFEFAKRALQMKVFDYLLKPVDNEVLVETAKRAMKELEYERQMSQKVVEALPLLRQRYLEQLIGGKLSREEILAGASFTELMLPSGPFRVISIRADDYSYPEYQKRFGKEMLKYCILNVAEETLGDRRGIVFDSIEDEIVLLCPMAGNQDNADQAAYDIAERIRANVETYLKTTITAGIGSVYQDVGHIFLSYRDARLALDYRHILGTNRVLSVGDAGIAAHSQELDVSGALNELVLKVKLGLETETLVLIDEIETLMIAKCITLNKARLIAMELVLLLNKEMDASANQDNLDEVYQRLLLHPTVHDIFTSLRKLIVHFTGAVNCQRGQRMKQVIHQAIEFMERQYNQEKLSLQDVAHAVHISPTYLSTVFKKEKNINFSDYLMQIRMKAAMELLRLNDLKTYEVAERVGFGNSQYFSVCFKKYTGVSPTDFRV
jgi:two-component system response regulator YesN